jgi:glycosyltransferase involved in cell wall biosynthesis
VRSAGRARRITVNGAYAPQRVTGQQRYATEIAECLGSDGVRQLEPTGWFAGSTLRTWGWVSAILPVVARNDVLLTMTSRSPLAHGHHVVVVHDLFVLTHPEWYSRKYVLSHAPLLKSTLKHAKAVIAVSEPVAEQVRRSGLTNAKVTVAPNAPSRVFTESAPEADSSTLERYGLASNGYVLVVGSLDPRKNLARLIEAYASLDATRRTDARLVVVGGGSAVFRDVGIDWPADTVLTGYVTDLELADLYRHARGVVFPSLAEGFGLPIVEAASVGARLAVSEIDVFRWIGGESIGYFDPLSVEDIARGIAGLIDGDVPRVDAAVAAALGERFNWKSSAATVLAVCREVSRG